LKILYKNVIDRPLHTQKIQTKYKNIHLGEKTILKLQKQYRIKRTHDFRFKFTEEQIKFIIKVYSKLAINVPHLLELLHKRPQFKKLTFNMVHHLLNQHNIPTKQTHRSFKPPNKRMTQKKEQAIITMTKQGLSPALIKKELGFKTHKTIYDILRKHNISSNGKSSYNSVDHNTFENITTEQQAYWLGMLITDGWVQNNNCNNEIGIQLQEQDKYILENLKNLVKTNNQIMGPIYHKKYNKSQMYRLTFFSAKIKTTLAKYGIVPRKSFKTFLPILPNHLMPHLLRGIIDGDGCIYFKKPKYVNVQIAGTLKLCQDIDNYLITKKILKSSTCKNKTIYVIHWYNYAHALDLLKFIYSNATIYLKRKHDKIKHLL
jgi:hypothetical protein